MPLVGTAGHVDHGKSTLILALSGRDPDRWAEEKRRGLTIDLGFAWADIGGGTEVSFVDVPGHERYLKNMLAGVDAFDVVILVVAANEGWMPQTEEHLAALDLLGVERGVVALTKVDTVDTTTAEEVKAEIASRLEGSSLVGSTIVSLNAPGGVGLEELKSELLRLCSGLQRDPTSRPRLWVDRSFSVAGAGTVVTGSLLGGTLRIGDELRIYPGNKTARVRSLQSHEKEVEEAVPGTRVAMALVGVDRKDVGRGDMIARYGQWQTTQRFVVSLRPARYVDEITGRGAYQLHIGTATINVRILRRFGERALVSADTPVPAAMGDRFILRDTGRRLVVAGGVILDPAPVSSSLEAPLRADEPADVRAVRLLELRGIDRLTNIINDSGGGFPDDAVTVGDQALSPGFFHDLTTRAENAVRREHETRPLRNGVPIATLAGIVGIDRTVLEKAVESSALLEVRGPDVALLGHEAKVDDEAALAWSVAREQLAASLAVPSVADLGLPTELLHLLIRQGDLISISEALVYLPAQIDEIVEIVSGLEVPFGVGAFKEATGLSRKYSVPILEWLDKKGYTIRRGDSRVLGSGG